jgi:hypothetical protein
MVDEVIISENQEASYILVSTALSAVTGFIASAPIPIEWKVPAGTMTSALVAGILVYWKTKVNKQKA